MIAIPAGLERDAPLDPRAIAAARANPCAWAALVTGGEFQAARHLRLVAEQLLRVARGEVRRLIVSMPPGHGKSWLISRFFPGWWLGLKPKDRVILVSMSEELTRTWSKATRDDLATWGPQVFGVGVWARAKASSWQVIDRTSGRATGGGLIARGIDGTITGNRADLFCLDDTYRDEREAANDLIREARYSTYRSAAVTRMLPGGAIVILMTRWHDDDIIGRLLSAQARGEGGYPWTVINLPAIAEEHDPLGRAVGEALWPEYYPLAELEPKRREVGPYTWSALYQGRPTPVGGGMFKRSWLRYYDLINEEVVKLGAEEYRLADLVRFGTCDLSTSQRTDGDYTAIAVWAWHAATNRLFLVDMVRARIPGPELVPTMRQLVDKWTLAIVYVERAGYQLSALSMINAGQREGLPLKEIKPEGDKIARALPLTAALEGARMFLPRGAPWLMELERELLTFPGGAHDDQVDALAYGVIAAAGFVVPRRRPDAGPAGGGWWNGTRGR